MKPSLWPLVLIWPVMASLGCGIRHTSLAGGQMELYWYLDQDVWPQAHRPQWRIQGKTIPTKWAFTSAGDARGAMLSVAMTAYQVTHGHVREVNIPISPDQARSAADMLRGVARMLEDLNQTVQQGAPCGRWAQMSARAAVVAETIARSTSAQQVQGKDEQAPSSLLSLLLATLGEQLEVQVLAGRAEETRQLREQLMDAVLKAAFAAAGRAAPESLSKEIMGILDQHAVPAQAQAKIEQTLLDRLEQTGSSDAKDIGDILKEALAWAPPILLNIEQFARQWDKMESVCVEFGIHEGQPVVAVTVKVLKGKQVRLRGVPFQPDVVLLGTCRITIQPRLATTGQTIVLLEGEAGACRVEFTGLTYALARLAVPLANGALREVRVASAPAYRGPNHLEVLMLMEADGPGDRRRIAVLHSSSTKAPDRQAFSVEVKTFDKHRLGSYVTPTMLYGHAVP